MAIYRKNRGRITTYLASEGVKIPNINITKGVKDRAYAQNGIIWSYEPATDNFGREIFILLRNGERKRKSERSTDDASDFMYVTSEEKAQAALAKRSGQIGLDKIDRADSSWRKGRQANVQKGLRAGHKSGGKLTGKRRASSQNTTTKKQRRGGKKLNAWQQFVADHRGEGYSMAELADMARKQGVIGEKAKSNPRKTRRNGRGKGRLSFYDLY